VSPELVERFLHRADGEALRWKRTGGFGNNNFREAEFDGFRNALLLAGDRADFAGESDFAAGCQQRTQRAFALRRGDSER